jgi:site-specific recombinase XerD
MKTIPTLVHLRPKVHQSYRQLPIFGRLLDAFISWAFDRGYSIQTIDLQLDSVRHLAAWFRKRGRRSVRALTAEDLAAVHHYFSTRKRAPRLAWGLHGFGAFLQAHGCLKPCRPKPLSRSELELARFLNYLRKDRGLAESTCAWYQRRVGHFLKFLGLNRHKLALTSLTLRMVQCYLRKASGRHPRKTMKHVVGAVRGFLRFQFMQGGIQQPLHTQIDTGRTYQDEHLPYPVQWSELKQLLRRINRSTPLGLRDYAILQLAVTYGLRASDIATLTLDDIDWRGRTIRIVQCKTRQPLSLPLTDKVGTALTDYLRRGRSKTARREVFLRQQAPIGPLSLQRMANTLRRASQTTGVILNASGFRCLRHSVALRLLRQGASIKEISDLLGHRSPISTAAYLRLNVEELRQVALPVPPQGAVKMPQKAALPNIPLRQRIRARTAPSGWDWRSFFRKPVKVYLANQRALGRNYETPEYTLRGLDFFLVRHYPRARSFTAKMFVHWAAGLRPLCPTTARMRMLCVRKFCCQLARSQPGIFIPDLRTFPVELPHQAPYLLSEAEVARTLAATDTLRSTRNNPIHSQTIRIALLLLFCCGLRRGEVLKLRLTDIDTTAMVLCINETKFYKSRLVPVASSVAGELCRYLAERRRKGLPMGPDAPLVWNGRLHPQGQVMALSSSRFLRTWQRVCICAQVFDHRGRAPRLHDLRHSFAVEALRRAYNTGQNAQTVLPYLARYMGHAGVKFTHYYLKFTEPLRCAASDNFRQHLMAAVLPPFVAKEGGVS